jgi:chitodextrinase
MRLLTGVRAVVLCGVVGALIAPLSGYSAPKGAPTISNVTPMSGAVGSTVTITGTDFVGVDLVSFYDYPTSFTVVSPTQITATVPAGTPSPGRWRVRTPDGVAKYEQLFTVTSIAPTISSVSPSSGAVASTVTINGSGFVGVDLVSFYDYPTTFTVVSPTQITARVPAGTPSPGRWRVRAAGGIGVSGSPFTVTSAAPTIASVSPMSGSVGSLVTITGSNFNGADLVSFYDYPTSYTVVSSTQITATVPSGTPSPGRWRVRTPVGTGVYEPKFTVGSDTSAPTAPTGLAVSSSSDSSITISWSASSDNVGVTGYGRYRNGGLVSSGAGTSFTFTGLSCATSYSFGVDAYDAADNRSPATSITASTGACPPAPGGLVASYGFDEGTGANAIDSSGNSNTGALSNGAAWTAGKFGTGISLDGVDDRVNVGDSASLDLSSAMTIEAWLRPSVLGSGWRTVVLKERTSGHVYALYANTSGSVPSGEAVLSSGAAADATSTTQLPLNTWTHLAVTYDGTTLRLWVNGTQVDSTPAAGGVQTSTGALRIGSNSIWGEPFQGQVDEVRIYGRALTSTEIRTDMTTSITGSAPPPGDTQAPSVPPNVTVTGTTSTSVAVSWNASSDNVGVTGYGRYRNGVLLSTGPELTYSFTGLTCGTTYTFAVDATDAVGNRSGQASVSATTSACAPPPPPPPPPPGDYAQVFMSPSGNDSTCVRYASSPPATPAACRSLDRAYRVAQPGDVVEMAGGTYPADQTLTRDTSKNYASDSRRVEFRAKAGETPRLLGSFSGGGFDIRGVEHVTIRGLTGIADLGITPSNYCDGATVPKDILIENSRWKTMHIKAADGLTLRNNVIGNYSYLESGAGSSTISNSFDCGSPTPLPKNILIEGNTWENINRDGSGTHPECLIFDDSENVTIRDNVLKDCPGLGIFMSSSNGATAKNAVIEGNFIGCGDNGSPATQCSYPIHLRPDYTFVNLTIRFNSLEGSISLQDGGASTDYSGVRIYGNLGTSATCVSSGITYSYNVWDSRSCSSTESLSPHSWMNTSSGDFHLSGGAQRADDFVPSSFCSSNGCPALDIDGQSRPMSSSGARDAGADER